jgi:hypothetical protein
MQKDRKATGSFPVFLVEVEELLGKALPGPLVSFVINHYEAIFIGARPQKERQRPSGSFFGFEGSLQVFHSSI